MPSSTRVIPGPSEVQALSFEVQAQGGNWTALNQKVNAELLLRKYLPNSLEWMRVAPGMGIARENVERARLQAWISLANRCEIPSAVRERHRRGARKFELRTASRMIPGIGTPTVYEIGLTLHPLHGVPAIPGSSIKGVSRASVEPYITPTDTFADLWAWMREDQPSLPKELECCRTYSALDFIERLYGKETSNDDGAAGLVVFQDALARPTDNPGYYELDVVTPHFSKYYRDGGGAPDDRQNPEPHVFPVVRRGIRFEFALRLALQARSLPAVEREAWLVAAEAMVTYALTTRGVGGKTGVGYGYFAP